MRNSSFEGNLARFARAIVVALVALGAGCAGPRTARFASPTEGLDTATIPPALRADYEIFADRCSRCHTLARPLNSDFSTMEQWRNYVARMRRQPGSGISLADSVHILEFLEYFNAQRNAERASEAR